MNEKLEYRLRRLIGFFTVCAIVTIFFGCIHHAAAQTVNVTNAATMPPFSSALTVGQIGASIPDGVKQVATDGYAVFKGFSLTNPISVAVIALKNGSHYGGGVEAHQVLPGSPVSAGFGIFGVQTESKDATTGKTTTKLNFYDANVNLGVSQVENIPVLNIPITVRLFSGPFANLAQGGVLMGAQSGVTGNFTFALGKSGNWFMHLGGGVVNCSGAAAEGLKPAMPMANIGVIGRF